MKTVQKYLPILLLFLLLLVGWKRQWWRDEEDSRKRIERTPSEKHGTPEATGGTVVLNRRAKLIYTKHAICRMECRQVTRAEVAEILADGHINMEKSNPNSKPCPTYALEGYSHEGQHLRIVFAPCNEETKVITCIDLDKEWVCSCN
jgi:hypothetical protein